jgi:hypothetical protein
MPNARRAKNLPSSRTPHTPRTNLILVSNAASEVGGISATKGHARLVVQYYHNVQQISFPLGVGYDIRTTLYTYAAHFTFPIRY